MKRTLIILGLLIFVALVLLVSFGLSEKFMGDVSFRKIKPPENPNITEEQKFLFENQLGSNPSLKQKQAYLGIALNSSVETREVRISEGCLPDKPVVRIYPDEPIVFLNDSQKPMTLIVRGKSLVIGANATTSVSLEMIGAIGLATRETAAVITYRCSNIRTSAGYLISFPD